MIIVCDLMVQLGLLTDFKRRLLKWDGVTVPIKEPRGILGETGLNNHEMWEVVMQNAELVSAREATERLMKILNITYAKADIKQVYDNATQMNAE